LLTFLLVVIHSHQNCRIQMKTKSLIFLTAVSLILWSFTAQRSILVNDLVGTWKYLISDVPEEYQTGLLVFEKSDNKIVGYIGRDQQTEVTDLTVNQDKITFTTENQSGVFKYNFSQKGDTLTGIIASQYGDFAIKAIKQAK
jgi:hypothetical protein